MKLCLVILLVATALAVPVPNTDNARLPTCAENRFTEGKRYLYSYQSESVTGVVGTSERLSGLKIDCTVQIQVPEQCELILTLQQCALKELDPDVTSMQWSTIQEKSSAFNEEMTKYPLHFTMDGGRITILEAHQDEPLNILNLKKGILSAFQLEQVNSTKSFTIIEESVFGNCPVDVKPNFSESKGRIDFIATEKDLTMCDRPSRNVPVPTLVEMITNMTLADKLFTSSQFCKHEINKRDQVNLIKCEERHVFRPMSYMDAGLQTNITQVLLLDDVSKENSKPKFDSRDSRPTNLVYEFEDEKVPGMDNADVGIEKLMTLVDSTLDEVKIDTPRKFTEFVAIIRSMSNETIHDFYPRAYNCSEFDTKCVENPWREKLARQYIYDGLSHCVTQPCFSLINTMIAKQEINTLMAHTMLYTMAMQPYPTEVLIHETLRIAQALRSQSSILTLSTMVHNHWVNTPEVREQRDLPEPLYNTIAFLKDIIKYDCSAETNEIDAGVSVESNRQILLALKAIGNIGEPVQTYDNDIFGDNDKVISSLLRCAKNPAAPRNITLAAVQAFRRFNIRTAQFTPLKEILLDRNMDVEVRIVSYLMIMRSSPAKRDLLDIINEMRTEPVVQVRAFIGSHLQNLLETEEPSLQDLRDKVFRILDANPLPEYPRNILKYSRNIEFSKAFRLPYINKTSSSQFDTNIIYNSDGFLPRAAMLNTTLNVLGRSLYMIEFGIDMQGYEQTLEAMFGPQGYFPDAVLKTMYIKSKDLLRYLNETYQRKSLEYNLPEKMELLSSKADQMMAMAQPYIDMASPYIEKAIEKGKPIMKDAEKMMKPIIKPIVKKVKSKLSNLAEALPDIVEPTTTTETLVPNNIQKGLDKIHTKVSHLPEPRYIAVYLRAFENELGFTTLEDMLSMIPRLNVTSIKQVNMQMVADLMNDISKKLADGVELNMTKSIILVQREWVIPTSIGMPLNVSLNGTSSMALRTLFRMKVDDIKQPMFIAGKFAPSIAVEVAGKMGVTLPLYGETGVLANATVYHSSNVAGNVTYKKGRLRFNLKNIQEPMNLFNFSTNLYLVRPDDVLEYLPGVKQDRSEYKFCTNVSRLVADDLCLSFAYPNASYAYAPRFPLSGPVSFNLTLVPTDSVEAFTMEASLRREKTPTAKKSFSSIGKAAMKPRLLRDIVHFNFSAPGKTLTRNISSLLIVDYQKTELQWNFTIPEVKAFRIYAGILNLEDTEKNRIGYHLTYNISAAEIYNTSTSLTLMSESDDMKTNCSVILSTNIMAWRHTYAAQYLNVSGNWIASLNETYYWDNETALYKQILWPFNDYQINPDMFHTAYILVKSNERECLEVDCERRERVFETSLFRQNFTLNNTHTVKPLSTVNTLNVTFANDFIVYPIVNFTVQKLDKSEMDIEKYEVTVNASRHERYIATIQDITRVRGEYNHSIRFVYYSVAKTILPQFDEYLGFPGTFDYYGDAMYKLVPSFLNTTIELTLRNETATMEEEIKPLRLLSHVKVSYPNMMNLHEQQSFSVVAKIANDSIYENNEHSYWGHFNVSVPHLKFNTSFQAAVVKGQDGITVGHNFTLVDQKRVQKWSYDTVATWMPLSSNFTWNTTLDTPVLNISYDHVQFKNDGGFQWIFNDTTNNTLTNYLNHTVFGHFEMRPEHISLNASLWTKMFQINGSHILKTQGPIVDLSWESIRLRAKSMYKKARAMDYRGLYDETKIVSKNLIDSSFNLTNSLNISTPTIGNMTFDHKLGFGIYGLNETMKLNLTHVKYGLESNLFTNLGLNQTCFRTHVVAESKSPLHLMQGNSSFVLFKSAPMEIGLMSASHMGIVSSKGNATLNGTFIIDSMRNPWSFKSVNGTLKYNVTSPIISAHLNSSADFKEFVSPFNFKKVAGALKQSINSSIGNMTCDMSVLLDNFRSILSFDKVTGRIVHIMDSKMANASSVSDFNLIKSSDLFKFDEVNATTINQLISKKANLTSDAEIVLRNFASAFKFDLVTAKMNHNLATCIGNVSSKSQASLTSSIDSTSISKVNATTVNAVSSKWVNASSDMGLIMEDVISILNFQLLKGKMNHTVTSRVANLTSVSQVKMDESMKLWKFSKLNVTSNNNLTAPLVNIRSDIALLLNEFTSMYNFRLIDGSMKHRVNSYFGKMDSDSKLNMVNSDKLFSFENVNITTRNNITSRISNMTSDVALLMKNFRSATNFDLISGSMVNVLNTGCVNGSSNNSIIFSNFESPMVFEEVNATTSNILTSKLANVESQMLVTFQEFSSLFNFGKVNTSMAHKVISRWVNGTSISSMVMHNFTSPVTFSEANFTSRNNMTSKIANLTSEADVNFREFISLLNFRKMSGNMKTIAFSKWMNVSSESSILLNNHECLFKFEEFNATTKQLVRSSLTNLTSDVVLRLENFRSLFNFDKVNGTMVHNFTSRYLNVTSNSSGIINSHEKLFKFEEVNATITNLVNTPLTNVTCNGVFRLQNFRSIFNFARIEGNMRHNLRSMWLNATSNSSGMINNHEKLFKFEEMSATTTNRLTCALTNISSDIVMRLQNFRSIFNFDKINGTMVHNITSRLLNVTSNSSGIINNHSKLFSFEEIRGSTSNYVTSCWAKLSSDVVLRMQDFVSIFKFNKVNGTAVHKLDSKLVNVTSNSSVIFHDFKSMFSFSEANTTLWNSVNSTVLNVTSEMALKLKQFRSILNFDLIHGLSHQSLDSRFFNASTKNLMFVDKHEQLFKFERINGSSDNQLRVLSTNLTTAALLKLENFRSLLSFDRSAVSGNFTIESKMANATSNNTFVINQHRGLFNFDDIKTITDSKVKVFSTNVTSRIFFGLDQFRSIFNFDKIAGDSNFGLEFWMVNGSSKNSMMVLNHPALFVFDEANATTINKLNLFNCFTADSESVMKMKESTAMLKFKKLETTTNNVVKCKFVNMTSNSSVVIDDHKKLFKFNEANMGSLNKLRTAIMNITSETIMRLSEFEKMTAFKKVNGSMRHRIITPILNTTSESVIILDKFQNLFKFPEARTSTSNNITSRFLNVTTFAGWERTDSESLFEFSNMNTAMKMNVSLPIFVVSTNSTTDFVNFRGITTFDKVNGVANIMWDKCNFMNSTGRAEFTLDNFRSLFEFTKANASVSYNTTSKLGQFTTLTRASLDEFRTPFEFEKACMDTTNNLTTPLAAFQQEAGLTINKSTEFLKFEGLRTSSRFNISSKLVNLTGLEAFMIEDMSSLFEFSRINFSRQYNLTNMLANITLRDGIEMKNFNSLFEFERVNTTMDYKLVTPVTNATWLNAVELKEFTSPLVFKLINLNATMNVTSEIASFDHFSGLALQDFDGSLLKFKLINGTMRNQIKSKLANLTTKSDVTMKNFLSLFNFENINSRMSYNLTTPLVESNVETVLDMLEFTSWKDFKHIETGHNFTVATKMVNVTTNGTIRMTKWTVFHQSMSVNVSTPVAEIDLLQTSDNQSVHFKVTSPKHGSLAFLGKISDDGKLMNMTLYHMTTVDKLNVTDLQWLLMLNKSNVIYSNFSWNPSLIDGALNLTNDLIATTINITMTAINQTMNYTRYAVNATRDYMNDQFMKLNETYQNIDEISAKFIQDVREQVETTLQKSKEYAVEQWRNAKEYDYDALWQRTVEKYESLKEDLAKKYEELKEKRDELIVKLEEKYEELKVKAVEKADQLKVKFDELIVKIEEIIKNKDHPINILPMKYFNKSIYEILEVSKEKFDKMMEKIMKKMTKVQETLKVAMKKISDPANALWVKVLEKTGIYMAQMETKIAEWKLVYNKLKRMYEESDREAFEKFIKEIIDDLSLKFTELSKKVQEKTKIAIEEAKKILKVIADKSVKAFDKVYEKASQKLKDMLDKVVVMSKDRSNTLNKWLLRFTDLTVYEIAKEIEGFAQDQLAVMLSKLESYKEKFEILMLKVVEESIRISMDEHNLINKYAIKYLGRNINELVKEAVEKLIKLVEDIKVKSKEAYLDAQVKYADAKVKMEEYKVQAVQMYNDFDKEVFREQVKVFIAELPEKVRTLSTEVMEKAKVIIEKVIKELEVIIKDAKVKLEDFIDEAKVKFDEVVDQVVEMSKNESNAINRFTLKYLDRTVYEIVEELIALYKKKIEEAKIKTQEIVDKVIEEVIAISLNETHFINKYALKYTGRNVNELVKEGIKNITELVEQVREKAVEIYDEAKVKFVEYKEKAIEKFEEYTEKAVEMYEIYSVKAVELYNEYSVKAVEKYNELRERLLELYEAFKVQVIEYYEYATNKTVELQEQLKALKEKVQNQPLNTSVREAMEYIEELAEKLRVRVEEVTADIIQFYEENLTEDKLMKLREDTKKYIEDKIQPIIEKLEEINEERVKPIINKLEEIGKDVSKKTMEVLEDNKILNLTRRFAEKTREFLAATRALNLKAVESAQEVIRILRESVEAVIEYLNNTMPGWIYRYYEIDQIPTRVWESAVEAAQTKMEEIPMLLRMTPELAYNLTRSTMGYSFNMSRSALSYTLNSIGQVGEHSFAMNISHPLNYTSFYRPPTLTNKQWEMVEMVQNKTEDVCTQIVMYYNATREYINETYPIVIEWIKEQEPIVREKYQQISEQVEILRDQAVVMYGEWKVKAESKYAELKVKVDELLAEAKVKYEEIREKAELKYEEIREKAELMFNEYKVKLVELYKEYLPIVKEEFKRISTLVRDELPNWRTHLKTAYNLTIEEYRILRELVIEKYIQMSEDAVATYNELKDKLYDDIIPRVEKKMNEIIEVVRVNLEKMKLKLKENYKKLSALIKKELPNWKEHLNTLTNKMYEKFDELIVKALELVEKIKEKMPEIYEKLERLVDRIKELTPEYIKENLPEVIEYIKDAIEYLEGMIRNIEYPQIQLPRLPTLRDIIPPFQSTGMIFGPLHVYTFDQKRYEFPGYKTEECTYILASDFVDRNFTILSTQDTVTLLLQEMSIKINKDNKVQLNSRENIQELPYQSPGKEVKIIRNGQWVQISTSYGLDIKCDAKYQMCLFNASRWYYNKTLGLLGTLNEEKHFDMRKPDGNVASDLTEFANAFEISGSTSCKIVPGRDEIFNKGPRDCSAEPSNKCKFLFSDPDSPLADCFDTINVTEFRSLCEEETKCYPELDEAICNATVSYVEMCRGSGRHIEHVQECNKCKNKVIGEVWETTSIPSADIVMIVSENMRMVEDHTMAEELTEIVEFTEKTLNKADINDNRYSLVAFGGADVHKGAHQHTINGKVFANSSEFSEGANSLEFFGDYETDSLDALQLATELEFRDEATKIFILVVEEETDAEVEEQLAIQALLEKNDITLNVISSYETLKQVKSSKKIVGINWDGKAIMSSKSEKDSGIKLDMPRGSYAKLAKASKGAVFSLDQLQRQVKDVTTHCAKRIRNQVERPLVGDLNMKQCECERNMYGRAASKCQVITE